MRSANDDARLRRIPRELANDHQEFLRAVQPWLEQSRASLDRLRLLTEFGMLVHEQSRRLSLISKKDRATLFTRHVLDSLNPVSIFAEPPKSAIDVGSGGGFPGIPLAIAWPETRVALLESRERKVGFLERAIRELGLRNVAVVCARLEDLRLNPRPECPEAAFIRALAELPRLLEELQPICAPGARWIYYLGSGAHDTETTDGLRSFGPGAEIRIGAFGGRLLTGLFP